jgi:hypothetical protein
MRAMVSTPAPGGHGAMMVTGRDGKLSAAAGSTTVARAQAAVRTEHTKRDIIDQLPDELWSLCATLVGFYCGHVR